MDLDQLAIFTEVIKMGSFAEVARKRGVSPSTISRIIGSLEEASQVRLFERNTRSMEPTEHALRLHERLEPLLEEIETSFSELVDFSNRVMGKIRVTSTVSLGLTHLVPAITDFERLYPDVVVEFVMTDQRVDIINEKIDVAFRFGHLNDSNFISQKLLPLRYIACASRKYLQINGVLSKPKDIEDHNCISFLIPDFTRSWKFRGHGKKNVDEYAIKGNLQISNAMGLRLAALQGHGVALLPDFIIQKDLDKGRLVNVLPGYEVTASEFDAAIWIVFPSRVYLPRRTRVFIDFFRQRMASISSVS